MTVLPEPIFGADTETHKGYCRLLCIEDQTPFFTREIGVWRQLLDYLLDAPKRIAFWNIRFDIEAILKHFPEEFIKNLLYLTESEIQIDNRLFTFKLIPWKVWTIREMVLEKNRRRTIRIVQCFDAAQFYQTGLNQASKEVLGESKVEDQEFAASLNESEILWDTQLPRIIQYCQDDATKAGKLIRKFVEAAASEPIKLAPKNPISCAWYAKELIRQCIPEVKTIKSIRTGQGFYYTRPWKRWDNVGAQCYFGGRFEAFRKGTFHNAYNYDINSGYPYWIARLPNPYNLTFVKDYEPEGQWSMVKAQVWVPDDVPVGPLPYRTPESIIFPTGNWTGWFHKDELFNSRRFGVEFDIHRALNGYEPDGIQRPFESRITEFYTKRAEWKQMNDPRHLSSKVAMNSVYGVLYEKNERITETEETRSTEIDGHHLRKHKDNPGRYFYPYLAGWITSQTRIQILNGALPNPYDATHLDFFATDGILSDKKLNLPVSKKMGEWSLKQVERARVFGNGIYEFDGKMKTRGFRKDHAKDPRPLLERMKETPEGIVIEVLEKGPIHLGTSFKLRDYSLKDALTWIEKRKEMNITDCKKRIWPKFTINDLYNGTIESKPRTIVDNPLNRNPGLVWKGDTNDKPNLSNRFLLGKIEVQT